MVEQRANLDYALDDQPLEEAAELPNDDYLTTDRVSHVDPMHGEADAELGTDEADEADEPATYGAP